jgi:uncharacterized membrane protein
MTVDDLKGFPFHKVYLWLGLTFGLIWLVLLPPFQGPDEQAHFARAYMISEGNIGPANLPLPASIRELEEVLQSDNMRAQPKVKQDPGRLTMAAKIKIRPLDTSNVIVAHNYPPVAYLPAAAAIAAARAMDAPMLFVFYSARMAGFIFFLFAMYLLIRHVRVLKLPLLTIALMPMVIQQGIIVSADGVTIILILWLVVYVFNLAFDVDRKVAVKKDMAIMCLLSVAIALTKGPYVLVALLFFVIPREKFGRPVFYWVCGTGIILAGTIAALLWQHWVNIANMPVSTSVSVQSMAAPQLFTASMSPFVVIKKVFITFFDIAYWKSGFWLGWRDVRLPFIFLVGFFFLMLWPCFVTIDERDEKIRKSRRAGLFVLALMSGILIANSIVMCLALPQRPSGKIAGMEGRYYTRLLFPFAMAVYLIVPERLKAACSRRFSDKRFLVKAHLGLLTVLLIGASVYIFARYYL